MAEIARAITTCRICFCRRTSCGRPTGEQSDPPQGGGLLAGGSSREVDDDDVVGLFDDEGPAALAAKADEVLEKSLALETSDHMSSILPRCFSRAPDQFARMAVPAAMRGKDDRHLPELALADVVERRAVEEVVVAAGQKVDGLPVVRVDRPHKRAARSGFAPHLGQYLGVRNVW